MVGSESMPYSYRNIGGVLISPASAIEPTGGYGTDSVMLGQCNARPTVTFSAAEHCYCPWLVLISHPTPLKVGG